ncbi:hypothetical protein CVT25_002481 [Psilocybe cyanescens]|uniref:Uncharacterized protein n=1 Tax=Psilocybe cyanescens TaxID=93625 RepID=A0A409X4H5_PSICY|nr:hypothetical protein CVT25_002481 [Psilocybe cyanescens]
MQFHILADLQPSKPTVPRYPPRNAMFRRREQPPPRNSLAPAPHRSAAREVTTLLLADQQKRPQYTRQDIEHAAKQAVARRDEELPMLVMKRKEKVALALAKCEEEIMEALRAREVEIDQACMRREAAVRKEVEERIQWVLDRETAMRAEEWWLEDVKREVEAGMRKVETGLAKGSFVGRSRILSKKSKISSSPHRVRRRKQEPQPTPRPNPSQQTNSTHTSNNNHTNTSISNSGTTTTTTANNNNTNKNHTITTTNPALETPTTSRPFATYSSEFMPASTMKGVVLTATGETLPTPSPAELVSLFTRSPKVWLDFSKIFEFREGSANANGIPKQKQPQLQLNLQQQQHHQQFQQHRAQTQALDDDEELDSPPPSPSERKERERRDNTTTTAASRPPAAPPPTGIRRPSIRTSAWSAPARSSGFQPSTASSSDSSSGHSSAAGPSNHTNNNNTVMKQPKTPPAPTPPCLAIEPQPHLLRAAATPAAGHVPLPPPPVYDLADEETSPVQFSSVRCRTLQDPIPTRANSCASSSNNTATVGATGTKMKRRGSSGLLLRAVVAANNAGRTRSAGALASPESDGEIPYIPAKVHPLPPAPSTALAHPMPVAIKPSAGSPLCPSLSSLNARPYYHPLRRQRIASSDLEMLALVPLPHGHA